MSFTGPTQKCAFILWRAIHSTSGSATIYPLSSFVVLVNSTTGPNADSVTDTDTDANGDGDAVALLALVTAKTKLQKINP